MTAPKRKSRLILTAVVSVLIIGALSFAFWPRPTMVDLGTVARGAMRLTINEEGRTRVREAYVVSTPVAGQLQRVSVQPGDPVEKGKTVVAHMHPTNPAALDVRTREQALAAVSAAEAALRVARADRNAAIATLDLAQTELKRSEQLFERGLLSDAALDQARQNARVMQARADTSEAAIAMREAEIINAQAQLIGFDDRQLGAAIEPGSTDIPLYAPSDGVILRVIQQSETSLPAGAPIMEIGDVTGDLEVVVALLSRDAVQVKAGDQVIIADWGGSTDLAGRVARVDPFGVTQFSALGVEEQRVNAVIDFEPSLTGETGLGHGFRVETRIIIWQARDTLIVPASALFRAQQDWAVFVALDGRAVLRQLTVGPNNGVEAQVLDGLAEGERVILYPSSGLKEGARIAERTMN